METKTGKQVSGHAKVSSGKSATVSLKGSMKIDSIKTVHTFGKEDPTSAEVQRELVVLNCLLKTNTFLSQPFPTAIWRPWAKLPGSKWPGISIPLYFPQRPLNDSQQRGVKRALNMPELITMIHGPPYVMHVASSMEG